VSLVRGPGNPVDKEFFLVTRIVDLLLYESTYATLAQDHRTAALDLARARRSGETTGPPCWKPSST